MKHAKYYPTPTKSEREGLQKCRGCGACLSCKTLFSIRTKKERFDDSNRMTRRTDEYKMGFKEGVQSERQKTLKILLKDLKPSLSQKPVYYIKCLIKELERKE